MLSRIERLYILDNYEYLWRVKNVLYFKTVGLLIKKIVVLSSQSRPSIGIDSLDSLLLIIGHACFWYKVDRWRIPCNEVARKLETRTFSIKKKYIYIHTFYY